MSATAVFVPWYDDTENLEWVSCSLCSCTVINEFSAQVSHLIAVHPYIGKVAINQDSKLVIREPSVAPIHIVED